MRCKRTSVGPGSCPESGSGQGLVEYTLILALIALVAVVALVFFGDAIAGILQIIGDEIDRSG